MAQLYFFGNATHSQMTGMAILSETHTLVIDGGTRGDAAQIVELLLANGRTSVDAWFLTHPHHDHVGAITEVLDNVPTLCVNKIYYRFPSLSALLEMGARTPNERTIWYRLYDITRKEPQRFVTVETGMQFSFGELTVHVLRVYDPSITVNPVNNSSAVYRIDSPQKRLLVLGDLGVEGGEKLQAAYPADALTADYTQLAHHGQGGVSRAFYEYIRPKCCLWGAPDWLWDNVGANGPGSGPFYTLVTRKWMEELGVTHHVVAKDGTTRLEL